MPAKYLALIVFLWVVAAVLGGVIEGATLSSNETSVLDNLTSWSEINTAESWGTFKFLTALPSFFSSLFTLMTFDFAFFDGGWELVRWFLFVPLMVMTVFGLVVTFLGLYQRLI